MNILLTTSKKPSKETISLCKKLKKLKPKKLTKTFFIYEPRGAKSFYQILDIARKKGLRRIAIIYDKNKAPFEMRFLSVSLKDWKWGKTIKISDYFKKVN